MSDSTPVVGPAGGGQVGRPYMPPEYMWPQSEGMHMAGPRPNGPMGMQNMPMSGPYMMPGVMPGMMPGMQMMGTGNKSLIAAAADALCPCFVLHERQSHVQSWHR